MGQRRKNLKKVAIQSYFHSNFIFYSQQISGVISDEIFHPRWALAQKPPASTPPASTPTPQSSPPSQVLVSAPQLPASGTAPANFPLL
ncbi:hypothetical protein Nepgr_028988 [Nepenthes gracilis]|uniref:Uncharacterized protein n=1 Tax=Nepenthes gracilis TaxID=150966 RepID=A0AAD3TCR3_NEPGR|nr:hypothetical protein Nepgr_028988 [Nepenthes gracilis]